MAYAPNKADPAALRAFVSAALQKVDVPVEDADLTAEMVVDADLNGYNTHGIALFYTHYVQGIQNGEINPRANITVEQGKPTAVSVDGDMGLGFLSSHRAMRECMRMAAEYGTGWATVYNSTHSGAGAYYAAMAAQQRMIGMAWSTGGCTIAPPGGSGRLLGNNPFSFAAPTGDNGIFLFDMAPSLTIRPKIKWLEWLGQPMPDQWTCDDQGNPITDPKRFFELEGAIRPLGSSAENGGYKGFGLLLMSDILTGMLSGDGGSLLRRKGEHSHAFCAIDISAFPTGGAFEELMDAMIDRLHEAPVVEGEDKIRFPGERSRASYEERSANGIPIRQYVLDELIAISNELDVPLDPIWKK